MINGFAFLALAVVANISTNFSLKAAVQDLDTRSLQTIALGLLTSPWAWVGGISGFVLLGSFMAAIRTIPLSIAYPTLTAIAVIIMAVAEWWFQDISLGFGKVIGLGFVVAGIALVTMNA